MTLTHADNEARRRRGAVAAFSLVMLLVLLGFGALTIDVGLMQVVRAELQRTADAVVLGAVQDLDSTDPDATMALARAKAEELVAKNPVLNGRPVLFNVDRDLIFGRADMNEAETGVEFTAGAMPPNALQATVRYDLEYTLAKVFGLRGRTIRATAVSAVPPPRTADVVPISLPVPGFGPVDPAVAEHNPGKTSPSEPTDGLRFAPGEEVAVFFFGKGPRQPVHLVLDITDGHGVAEINRLLATEESLGGDREPFEASIGDEYRVWNEGTGNANFGEKLCTRLGDYDPVNDTVVMPIIEELESTRNDDGQLVGHIRIADFVAVTLTEVREVEVPDPDDPDRTMVIQVVFGNVVELFSGSGNGFGTTSGSYTLGSVRSAPLLIM